MRSRRAVLAGAGAVGAGGLVAASRVRLGDVTSWDPAADTWPLGRYAPASTARNPEATPPDDPAVAWTANPLLAGYDYGLVVGPERVYAGGAGVAALDRESGAGDWSRDAADAGGGPLALRGGTLYAAPDDDAPVRTAPALRAFDAADGSERWAATGRGVREATALVVADGTVFVGTEAGIAAVDANTGRQRWAASTFREPVVLVHDGRLHAAGGLVDGGTAGRYRTRTLLDVPRGSSPPLAWTADAAGVPVALAAAGDALVGGFRHGTAGPPDAAGLKCFDPGGGGVRWRAVGPTDSSRPAGGPLALTDDAVVAGIRRDGDAVAAFGLADGSERWRRGVDGRVVDLAIAGGTALVATAADRVRALRAADGTEQWRVTVLEVQSVAPVDGAVFAVTSGGRVVALR